MVTDVCPASDRRSKDTASDSKVVEGGSVRRWRMVGDEDRNAAGCRDFPVAGEYLSALCLRSVGECVAGEDRNRRSDRHPLRGRSRRGVPIQSRCRTIPEGIQGTAGEIWLGTAWRENTAHRIWSVCRGQPEQPWRRKAGVVYVSRLHARLREAEEDRNVYGNPPNSEETDAANARTAETGPASPDARYSGVRRRLAQTCSARLLWLFCRAWQHACAERVSLPSSTPLASRAATTQSARFQLAQF